MKFYRSIVVGLLYFSSCGAMQQSGSNTQSSTAESTSATTGSFVIIVSQEPKIQAPESTYGEAWLRYGQYCQNVRMQSTSAVNLQQPLQRSSLLVPPAHEAWVYNQREIHSYKPTIDRQLKTETCNSNLLSIIQGLKNRQRFVKLALVKNIIIDDKESVFAPITTTTNEYKEQAANAKMAACSSASCGAISLGRVQSPHDHNVFLVKSRN